MNTPELIKKLIHRFTRNWASGVDRKDIFVFLATAYSLKLFKGGTPPGFGNGIVLGRKLESLCRPIIRNNRQDFLLRIDLVKKQNDSKCKNSYSWSPW